MSDDTERHTKIEARAYTLWVEAGQPEGRAEEFWHLAKAQIEDEERPGEGPRQPPAVDNPPI